MSMPDPEDINIAEDVVLQFGKYRGRSLEDTPDSYVKWLAENHDCEFLCVAANTVFQDGK
jgi:uncharacterized protein (DUF3820 family)